MGDKLHSRAPPQAGAEEKSDELGAVNVQMDRQTDIRTASSANALWKASVRGLRIRFRSAAAMVETTAGNEDVVSSKAPDKTKPKQVGWVQRFCSLFQSHSRKESHGESHSERPSLGLKYGLLRHDVEHALPSAISPLAFREQMSRSRTFPKQSRHNPKAGMYRKSVSSVVPRKSNDTDSSLTFVRDESEPTSQESVPLLLENVSEDCSSENACSNLLESDSLTYHSLPRGLPAPWILRKWKLRDSQKFLRIDPAKELLFHQTDDKQYTTAIKLKNKTRRFVAFKFKSTSPKGYLLTPKHGVLAPHAAIEIKGQKFGDPSSSSRRKKDLLVVVTVPIPAGRMKKNPQTVSSSIGWYADGKAKIDASSGGLDYSLTSIPEEELSENHKEIIPRISG